MCGEVQCRQCSALEESSDMPTGTRGCAVGGCTSVEGYNVGSLYSQRVTVRATDTGRGDRSAEGCTGTGYHLGTI